MEKGVKYIVPIQLDEWQATAIRSLVQDTKSAAGCGWQPIQSEPKDQTPRLVSNDPTDPDCAHLVTLTDDGEHFDGDVVLEHMGVDDLSHWHPVPVEPVNNPKK